MRRDIDRTHPGKQPSIDRSHLRNVKITSEPMNAVRVCQCEYTGCRTDVNSSVPTVERGCSQLRYTVLMKSGILYSVNDVFLYG